MTIETYTHFSVQNFIICGTCAVEQEWTEKAFIYYNIKYINA